MDKVDIQLRKIWQVVKDRIKEKCEELKDLWFSHSKRERIGIICVAPCVLGFGITMLVLIIGLLWMAPFLIPILALMGLFVYGIHCLVEG